VSVVIIDLVLAGDNAVVVGMAAAGLPAPLRKKAIVYGIAAAALLRIVFATFTTQLLNVIGLLFAGGLLLLWVSWKLWRETRMQRHQDAGADVLDGTPDGRLFDQPLASLPAGGAAAIPSTKTFRAALTQIVVADVSMSLDNVLAVAGTARDHIWVLVIGLALSVGLMGVAATMIARLLKRFPWISYLGLGLIAYVALVMIWEGSHEIFDEAVRMKLI
jgi:YjbE family integral membrane protein